MEIEENTKNISDYLQIIKRRKKTILIPILVLWLLSIIVTLSLQPIYRSEAKILIEQQSIPLDMIKSTVVSYADQRIIQIQSKLMTISNISKIINKFNLYHRQKNKLTISELTSQFIEQTEINIGNQSVISKGRKSIATLSFKLAFEHKDPRIAQKVTYELANFFLEENKKTRTAKAKDITTFLDEEAKKFSIKIKKIELKIAEYKEKHSQSLPELLVINLATISRLETTIMQLDSDEKTFIEKNSILNSELLQTNPIILTIDGSTPDSLEALKGKYSILLSKYSKSHPDAKALKRLIDNFKEENNDKKLDSNINNPIYIQLRNQINLNITSLKNITEQKLKLNKRLEETEINVTKTPQVERDYSDLVRNLENNKNKYNDLTSKALEAQLSQTLEEEQKAEKFTLLEPPIVPVTPEKPNKIKILLGGFIFSIIAGLGGAILIEIMDGSIRSYKDIAQLTGVDLLVIIPYIKNQYDLDIDKKNKKILFIIIVSFVLILSAILALNFLYKPLYLIWSKLLFVLSSFI